MIEQNGIPSIVTAATTADGTTVGEAVVVPAIPAATFGSLVNDLLDQLDAKAVIIVDPNERRVWARSDTPSALVDGADDVAHSVLLAPDPLQTGKSLTYTAGDTTGFDAKTVAAIAAAIGSQKPKRSVQSLVSTLLSQDLPTPAPVIIIDQVAETVTVCEPTSASSVNTGLEAVVKTDSDQVCIELSASGKSTADPLIFEGGPTS